MRRLGLVLGMLAGIVSGACGGGPAAAGGERPALLVSAASSLRPALTAYGAAHPAADARFSFAGSDALAAQIRQGVKPDVYASADAHLASALHDAGLVERPVPFARGRLVLAVPAGSPIRDLDDLTAAGVTLAIGSASVPVGVYTRRALARLPDRQGDRILRRVRSHEPDVAGIVGKLTQGAADAGFVYATDVAATRGELTAIELPGRLQQQVTYAAAVVRGARRPALARAFVAGLVHGRGRVALRRAGFEVETAG